jgi:predicted transcriptional regulator
MDKLTITQLMATQNLSYKLLRSHIDRLLVAGLVQYEEERERRVIATTSRGVAISRCYGNAIALLNGSDAACPLLTLLENERPSQKNRILNRLTH